MSISIADVQEGLISGRLTRERMCDGKAAYWSYLFAEKRRKQLEKQFQCTYEIYACPLCGKWHMAGARESESR